jgi:membrane-associated protease RseP (regulator of RpoE activity)
MGMIIALFIFSLVIFVHEFGHYIVGLYFGARPKVFSIGFGAAIIEKEIKGTTFKLGMIPLGGYVKYSKDANEKDDLMNLANWKQILVCLAGPMFNFLFSYIMMFFLIFSFVVGPQLIKPSGRLFSQIHEKNMAIVPGFIKSVEGTNMICGQAFMEFIKITKEEFNSTNFLKDTSGPIGITHEVDKSYKTGSFLLLYFFTMFISFSLGITNLIPIGVLDGGRIVSCGLKMIFNEKRVGPIILWYDGISIALLLGLTLFTTIKDIAGLF